MGAVREGQGCEKEGRLAQGRRSKMKRKSCGSLAIGLTPPPTSLPGVHTPNTPEILNTIVSITTHTSDTASLPWPCNTSSPHSDTAVQGYRTQFIKEGLKMKVKKNMELATEDSLHKVLSQNIKEEIEDLSPEDEMRRKRRRERNKVAAEKCRNKKKKETLKLFAESEVVERANACYKEELARLEAEEKHLLKILETHKPMCQLQIESPGSQSYWTVPNSNSTTGLEYDCKKSIIDNTGDYIGDSALDSYEDTENLVESSSREQNKNLPSYFYPGYSYSSGYYGSACAAV